MTAKAKLLKTIRENSEEIKACGVKSVGIFGSFVNSSYTRNSDVDILIEFKRDMKAFDNYMDLKFLLEKLFHRKVDLVIKEALKPKLKKHVLKEVSYARL